MLSFKNIEKSGDSNFIVEYDISVNNYDVNVLHLLTYIVHIDVEIELNFKDKYYKNSKTKILYNKLYPYRYYKLSIIDNILYIYYELKNKDIELNDTIIELIKNDFSNSDIVNVFNIILEGSIDVD